MRVIAAVNLNSQPPTSLRTRPRWKLAVGSCTLSPVIVHVVMFRPRPDLSAAARRNLADTLIAAIRDIPSVKRARVGRRVTHGRPYEHLMRVDYGYAAMLEFDDLDGLNAYLAHPAHEALAARFFESFDEALMYDFDLREGTDAVAALL